MPLNINLDIKPPVNLAEVQVNITDNWVYYKFTGADQAEVDGFVENVFAKYPAYDWETEVEHSDEKKHKVHIRRLHHLV